MKEIVKREQENRQTERHIDRQKGRLTKDKAIIADCQEGTRKQVNRKKLIQKGRLMKDKEIIADCQERTEKNR